MEPGMTNPAWLSILVILLPVGIFLFTMLIIYKKLSGKMNLADVLTETEVVSKDGSKEKTGQKKSASRLILFISGITSVVLSVCMTVYYFYMNIFCIACNTNLEMADFTNILLALGIGVVPYSINQVKKIKL